MADEPPDGRSASAAGVGHDQGLVVVTRSRSAWKDRIRKYKVHIDGEFVGKIPNGGTLSVPLAPGTHEIQMTIDWTGSDSLSFTIQAGETVRFRCGAGPLGNIRGALSSVGWVDLAREENPA